MKEDIEYLEEFIKQYKIILEEYKDDVMQSIATKSCYFDELPIQAIENLIKGYKELEEELMSKRHLYEQRLFAINHNYVSKDKIREKIEGIKQAIAETKPNDLMLIDWLETRQALLEELLEEE